MNPQSEFISEAFHTIAQPIAALRATVELGLREDASKPPRQILEECLLHTDRLMQEMALLRECANLYEKPQLESCDGQALLRASVEEMAPVAESGGVVLQLDASPAIILCHAPTFQRAIFSLLDNVIARAGRDHIISIFLHRCEDGFMLIVSPGARQGPRRTLCRKLMHFAGGSAIDSATGDISVIFRAASCRQSPAITLADKQLLTSH